MRHEPFRYLSERTAVMKQERRSTALPGPRGLAQLAILRRLLRDPQPVLDELHAEHGPVCALGWRPARIAVVGDPAAIRALFALPSDSFRWGHRFNALGFVVGRASMIVSDGVDHQRRRGSVQAAFTRRRLNRWIPAILEQTDLAIDRIAPLADGHAATIDLYPVGRALVLDIIVRTMFGEQMAAHASQLGALFQRPQDYLESPALKQLPHPFPFTKRARVRRDRRTLDSLINTQIAERRLHPTGDPFDVLEALVQNPGLSDAEIRDQVVTLVGAGYDTTAASLAWMLWRAALEPGVWGRLRTEADAVFAQYDNEHNPIDATAFSQLDYANRVMRETVRLHPAGVISPRQATIDIAIGSNTIRKGTLILWSAHLAGRDPAAWPDPLRFDPDRFLNLEPAQQALADQAWVPFGGGVRNCIGFALSQMELTLIIARMAQRLDLTSTSDSLPVPVGMVVNRPAGGVPMHVAYRSATVEAE